MKAANLLEALSWRARHQPERVALRHGERSLTYAELERDANRVACALAAAGIAPETRIAIMTKNAPEQLAIWWGAMKAGAVLVLVNYRLSAREVAYIANDAQAELLFVGRDFHALAETVAAQLPRLRQVIAIDGRHASWPTLDAFVAGHDGAPPERAVAADDTCLQIYTSGTTGQPKGVLTSHDNLLADQLRSEAHGLWSERDTLLLCMPMCHIGGTGLALRCIWFGMCIELLREFDAAQVLRIIPERRVTKAVFVPAMLHMLLQTPGARAADLSSLDLIHYGAGAMPFELLQEAMQVFPVRFSTAFGMTETNGGVTHLGPEDHVGPRAQERIKSCGQAAPGVELRIADDQGRPVPAGTVGEILVRSRQCTRGYFRLPEESARLFTDDGWLRTGDAGYLDPEGYLFISDRLKDMIVSGSLKIFPREVEEVMLEHPAVSEVAIVGIPDPRWREVPLAFVVRRAGQDADEAALLAFTAERVARFKVPKAVVFTDALPRNTSGKVLKRELRQPYWEGQSRQV